MGQQLTDKLFHLFLPHSPRQNSGGTITDMTLEANVRLSALIHAECSGRARKGFGLQKAGCRRCCAFSGSPMLREGGILWPGVAGRKFPPERGRWNVRFPRVRIWTLIYPQGIMRCEAHPQPIPLELLLLLQDGLLHSGKHPTGTQIEQLQATGVQGTFGSISKAIEKSSKQIKI